MKQYKGSNTQTYLTYFNGSNKLEVSTEKFIG